MLAKLDTFTDLIPDWIVETSRKVHVHVPNLLYLKFDDFSNKLEIALYGHQEAFKDENVFRFITKNAKHALYMPHS